MTLINYNWEKHYRLLKWNGVPGSWNFQEASIISDDFDEHNGGAKRILGRKYETNLENITKLEEIFKQMWFCNIGSLNSSVDKPSSDLGTFLEVPLSPIFP